MTIYTVSSKPKQYAYGVCIGILQSNARIPMPPGDVGNASSFPYPVRYQLVEELTTERLIVKADPTLITPLIRNAQELESFGVAAIMGDCGHLIQFQREVAGSVNIPVFLSSWLQLPFIYSILPPNKKIGIIMANSVYFRRKFLINAGINENIPIVIGGMENQPAFRSAVIEESGYLDTEIVNEEIISVGKKMIDENPSIGAFLLECSDLPPYAVKLQEATGLPVFDFLTMANYVYSALVRHSYTGTY